LWCASRLGDELLQRAAGRQHHQRQRRALGHVALLCRHPDQRLATDHHTLLLRVDAGDMAAVRVDPPHCQTNVETPITSAALDHHALQDDHVQPQLRVLLGEALTRPGVVRQALLP